MQTLCENKIYDEIFDTYICQLNNTPCTDCKVTSKSPSDENLTIFRDKYIEELVNYSASSENPTRTLENELVNISRSISSLIRNLT